jgi:hypothetical protein
MRSKFIVLERRTISIFHIPFEIEVMPDTSLFDL